VRALVATVIAIGVLAGSAVAVAQHADTSGAARARMITVLSSEISTGDCGCTAPTRAKDRAADRAAAEGSTSTKIVP
jgi:hypothetical protein